MNMLKKLMKKLNEQADSLFLAFTTYWSAEHLESTITFGFFYKRLTNNCEQKLSK